MGNCGGKRKGKSKAGGRNTSGSGGIRIRDNKRKKREEEEDGDGTRFEAKIVLIGNSGVGKTSIALRYKDGKVSTSPRATIGASYIQKVIKMADKNELKLHIWDTGGHEKFRTL